MTFVQIQSLTQSFRAVEVFIRDKYERKKYYDQEALAAASQKPEAAAPSTSPSSLPDKTKSEKERDKKKEEKKKEKVADKVERHSNTKFLFFLSPTQRPT
ncbi:hypothetical protein ATANTOWER_026962, partial [Ataeniobius toweri]|nr:hypothetical protein [Ataeniobius toweri]